MREPENQLPTPPHRSAGTPRFRQLLFLVGGGLLLAFGGCLLFLGTMQSPISMLFGTAFIVGVLMFVVGIVAVVIWSLIDVFRSRS